MTIINSPGDLKTAIKNKEHEIMFHGRKVYIVYSKDDFQNAVDQKQKYVYPGNKKMEKVLEIVEENQDTAVVTGTTNETITTDNIALSGPTIIGLGTLFVILVLGILAILINHNLKITRHPDGSWSLETSEK